VSGLPPQRIDAICRSSGAVLALDNDDFAVVLGGPHASLEAAEREARGAGAHCTRLKVDVASHTPWMQAAADEFGRVLSAQALRAPRVPLFSNVTGRVATGAQAARALALQIAQTVRWSACMDLLHERRVGRVLEIGPGAGLARMWNQRFPDVPARSADEFRSAQAIVDWVLRR